ncbi:hypothetical protein EVAR_78416_1 [Eumeta japonica]|uniref:Uncharacterized protein n=1 Tax=Eumeta variegata TaxID=151549 RepID=A0A4C1TYF1_EUMVA|nr:hypothetical protein EVAR_78416_1 [Eumeta japonica]
MSLIKLLSFEEQKAVCTLLLDVTLEYRLIRLGTMSTNADARVLRPRLLAVKVRLGTPTLATFYPHSGARSARVKMAVFACEPRPWAWTAPRRAHVCAGASVWAAASMGECYS